MPSMAENAEGSVDGFNFCVFGFEPHSQAGATLSDVSHRPNRQQEVDADGRIAEESGFDGGGSCGEYR
ncbi:Uncharacterised protein [Klebsiella oxytoca]|nr:Uncharacterised protein [Klebsiella oxytoca]